MKEYVITDELRDKIIKWFNNIAEEADVLTTGNVSHKKAMIKGMAARSAEFVEKYSVGIADSANDLKEYLWLNLTESNIRLADISTNVTTEVTLVRKARCI